MRICARFMPTHPELPDFLARAVCRCGWSIKQMHKLMVLSQTYRMSSSDADALAVDPANNLLWRMNRQRLDAESIRDAMLAVAGTLRLKSGGPHPFPPVHTWSFSVHNPFKAIYDTNQPQCLPDDATDSTPSVSGRCSMGPDPGVSTDQRILSTTPSQALFMMNDPFVHEQHPRRRPAHCGTGQRRLDSYSLGLFLGGRTRTHTPSKKPLPQATFYATRISLPAQTYPRRTNPCKHGRPICGRFSAATNFCF